MSLTTVANVRQTGGIAEADAFLMFRVADDTALNAEVARMLARASAWLAEQAPLHYTGSATASANVDLLFTGAEEALTMHFLTMQLKARRVYGTHFPYDSEGSERFQELIDVEWFAQMNGLVGRFFEVSSDAGHPFALPVMGTTSTIQPEEIDSVTTRLGDALDWAENRAPARTGAWW